MGRKGLSPRHEKFCQRYLECGDAVQAMLHVYPHRSKWKPETQRTKAKELKRRSDISERIEELQHEMAAECKLTRDDLIDALARIIKGGERPTDYLTFGYDDQGKKDFETRRSVSYKWAVETLIRLCGYDNPSKIEVTGANGAPLHPEIKIEVIDRREDVIKEDEDTDD